MCCLLVLGETLWKMRPQHAAGIDVLVVFPVEQLCQALTLGTADGSTATGLGSVDKMLGKTSDLT